jgi:hypothetical protein
MCGLRSERSVTVIRAVFTVIACAAILCVIGRFLGWLVVGLIVVAGFGYTMWCTIQLGPWRMR